MHGKGQAGVLGCRANHIIDRKAGELIPPLTQKQPGQLGVTTLFEIAFERQKLVVVNGASAGSKHSHP
jgi:hypothetical protein